MNAGIATAPSVGFRCRVRAHLSDVVITYFGKVTVDRTRQHTLFCPTPEEAAREIVRSLGLDASAIRAAAGEGGAAELRLWHAGRQSEPLARVVGLSADQLNATFERLGR